MTEVAEPRSVPGRCNARMRIADNFGDNHATMVCQRPKGHAGRHRERWQSVTGGLTIVTWATDVRIADRKGQAQMRRYRKKRFEEAT